tara:strand:+ start:95 stop:532 length:438 start_codon:yes stop_codon:yes gene_type:complete
MPIKTFRGTIAMGAEDQISLHTNNGATGYRIRKFQLISTTPATGDNEYIGKITKMPDDDISTSVDLSDNKILAVNYYVSGRYTSETQNTLVIFDQDVVNQDIYVNITDGIGGTIPCNYYIELEQVKLDLNENTVATLKDIRNIQG